MSIPATSMCWIPMRWEIYGTRILRAFRIGPGQRRGGVSLRILPGEMTGVKIAGGILSVEADVEGIVSAKMGRTAITIARRTGNFFHMSSRGWSGWWPGEWFEMSNKKETQ